MKIGVVGLGLIGASLAARLKEKGYEVLGQDRDKSTRDFAKLAGGIDGELTDENIGECDAIFIAITPEGAIGWLEENGDKIPAGTLVMDCCGTKRKVCKAGFEIATSKGFNFVGGHPMAGKQVGGIKNSSPELFQNAKVAIVPKDKNDIRLMTEVKSILSDVGFTEFMVMTPEEHDQMIAFTSQMAHLVSNAYIKSDMAKEGIGMLLSGGAFRDMTRVAYLDEAMWTELFMENRDNLLTELEGLMAELEKYKDALEKGDEDALTKLLAEGKERKKEIDESN